MDSNDQPDRPETSERPAATEEMWRSVHAESGLLPTEELSLLLHTDPTLSRVPLPCRAAGGGAPRRTRPLPGLAPGEWPTPGRSSYARAVPVMMSNERCIRRPNGGSDIHGIQGRLLREGLVFMMFNYRSLIQDRCDGLQNDP